MKLKPLVLLSLALSPLLLQAETKLDKELANAKEVISNSDEVLAAIQADEKDRGVQADKPCAPLAQNAASILLDC